MGVKRQKNQLKLASGPGEAPDSRYADDCNIYVRSKHAGQRVKRSITASLRAGSSSGSTNRRARWIDR